MHFNASPLWAHKRLLTSRDPEETRAFMHAKEFELDLAPREQPAFDFAATAAYMPNSYIGSIRYGSAVSVRVPGDRNRDDYFIHLPVRGTAEVTGDKGSAICGPGQGLVSSPHGHLTHSERGSERITLSLTKAAVIRQLATLLGEVPTAPLDFAPTIGLATPEGRRFSRHVRLVIADLDDPGLPLNQTLLAMYEQVIMTGLLLCQNNSYTNALRHLERGAAPRGVKRAVDYIQNHLSAPITLGEIIAASGVPGRTLLKHFRDDRGTSPMRYVHRARLGRIRQELSRARAGESVTEIALAWGIHHLGRFAGEYRAHFGESPSETLSRSRGR